MVKSGSVQEAMNRLRDHGFEPYVGGTAPHWGTAVDFSGRYDDDLEFLRPDILPPRKP